MGKTMSATARVHRRHLASGEWRISEGISRGRRRECEEKNFARWLGRELEQYVVTSETYRERMEFLDNALQEK